MEDEEEIRRELILKIPERRRRSSGIEYVEGTPKVNPKEMDEAQNPTEKVIFGCILTAGLDPHEKVKENGLNSGKNRKENGHIIVDKLHARNCPQKVEMERGLEKKKVILSPKFKLETPGEVNLLESPNNITEGDRGEVVEVGGCELGCPQCSGDCNSIQKTQDDMLAIKQKLHLASKSSIVVDPNEIGENTCINLDAKKVTVNDEIGLVDVANAQKVTNFEALKCKSDLLSEKQCHLYSSLSLVKLNIAVNTIDKTNKVLMDKSVSSQPDSLVIDTKERIASKQERKTGIKKKEVKMSERKLERKNIESNLKASDLKEKIKLFETKEKVVDIERKKEKLKCEKERKKDEERNEMKERKERNEEKKKKENEIENERPLKELGKKVLLDGIFMRKMQENEKENSERIRLESMKKKERKFKRERKMKDSPKCELKLKFEEIRRKKEKEKEYVERKIQKENLKIDAKLIPPPVLNFNLNGFGSNFFNPIEDDGGIGGAVISQQLGAEGDLIPPRDLLVRFEVCSTKLVALEVKGGEY